MANKILVSKDLLDEILEDLYDLKGERGWYKDEPRCNYQKDYQDLVCRIGQLEDLLSIEELTEKTNENRTNSENSPSS